MKTEYKSRLQPFWESHMNAWKETTLSQSAYCQEHDLVAHQFGYWKRKLVDIDDSSVQQPGFVQLKPFQQIASTSVATLSLQLPNQLRIEGITSDNILFAKELAGLLQ